MNRLSSISIICSLALFAGMGLFGCGTPSNSNANGNANTYVTATPKSTLKVDCSTASNPEIVKAIYDAIAQSAYANEVKQFNITAEKPAVKVVGWSTHKTELKAIIDATAPSPCVVNYDGFADSKPNLGADYQQRIGCPTGYGPCGDICIRIGEQCNVVAGPAQPPVWDCNPAKSPTPTPSPITAPSTAK